ncbi:MAG: sulfite exporter TauE/SafE family protein [Rhizomicrobium sp.]
MIQLADLLSVGSGVLVGFALGLLGGGGSILATPLLLYVVGVKSPHVAIGTGALAVSVNAFANLVAHSRAGNVKWPCAATFAISGVAGALAGAALGKAMDGSRLLFLFGLVMVAVAVAMLSPRAAGGDPQVRITPAIALRLVLIGALAGLLSGFFGIGGGFLIVPGIMLGSGMTTINAVGSSLVSVGTFGLATAVSYAWAGLVDWRVAAFFIFGGILGGLGGVSLSGRLAGRRVLLARIFAGAVFMVAGFVLWRSAPAFFA